MGRERGNLEQDKKRFFFFRVSCSSPPSTTATPQFLFSLVPLPLHDFIEIESSSFAQKSSSVFYLEKKRETKKKFKKGKKPENRQEIGG